MDAEDKQVRVIKLPARKVFMKRAILRTLTLIIIAIIVILLAIFIRDALKKSRSSNLVSNVTHLSQTSECSTGLQKIGPIAPALNNDSRYTRTAREKALEYLMACSNITGNNVASLTYANELNGLYIQDKNISKQRQISSYIAYIKRSEQH